MSEKIEWLGGLEAKVREASERLAALRQENRKLLSQMRELEGQLAAAEARAGESAVPYPEANEAWKEERDEIRRRVESLTQTLEELIAEPELEEDLP